MLDLSTKMRNALHRAIIYTVIGAGILYFVFPGAVIGILILTGAVSTPRGHMTAKTLFALPLEIGEEVGPIGKFYQWQCYVISGEK